MWQLGLCAKLRKGGPYPARVHVHVHVHVESGEPFMCACAVHVLCVYDVPVCCACVLCLCAVHVLCVYAVRV